MGAGISFGCAEATSNIIAGVIIKYFKDTHALLGCFGLSFFCQLIFYFSGANEGGFIAFAALFVNMLGIGGAFIVIYFMVD
jgi:predicted MFS family arabinose efflux permease